MNDEPIQTDGRPHQTRRESSPDESVRASERSNVNNTRIDISERTLSTLALVFASMALVVGIWCLLEARAAKNRADVAIMRTEGFTRALIAKGINPYPHVEGEDQ